MGRNVIRKAQAGEVRNFHEGVWLKVQIAQSGLAQAEFARKSKIPLKTLTTWFVQPVLRMRLDNLQQLANALGFSAEQFLRQLYQDSDRALPRSKSVWEMLATGLPIGEEDERDEENDQSGKKCALRLAAEIPLFELSLAAGPWTDVLDVPEVCDPNMIEQGLFRVRLAGDSMTPRYKDGEIVEFHCLRVGDDIIAGRDYYVQLSDGSATFKRVERADEAAMVLRALNRRRFPGAITVELSLVVRMALAVAKVELIE